jgi:catechol 2,3-dioxygenase-like lactoylglutathione lyase family enzyme
MTIKIKKLLHICVRVDPDENSINEANAFYSDVLGLQIDTQRPEIKGIPGFWVNISDGDRTQQVHVMGATGASPVSRSKTEDPTRMHIAFAVENIDAARSLLAKKRVEYWEYGGLVGQASLQIFFEDPCGNMIELQED